MSKRAKKGSTALYWRNKLLGWARPIGGWQRDNLGAKMLLIALVDAMTTQLYLDFAVGGFRIALSVVLLPVFLYFNPRIHPIKQAFFVMTVGLASRCLFGMGLYNSIGAALIAEYHTAFFDLCYGVMFYTFFYRQSSVQKNLSLWFMVILSADFVGNVVELTSRYLAFGGQPLKTVPVLFFIASVRSCIAILMVLVYQYYLQMLKREDHNERYQELVLLVSQLSAETYLMQKNMVHIEGVMTEAYALYERHVERDETTAKAALGIAKDVHEIKKSYLQVIEGLGALTGDSSSFEAMGLRDLCDILNHSLQREKGRESSPPIDFDIQEDLVIHQHFWLMSVIRNLVINGLEAMENTEKPQIQVSSRVNREDGLLIITVSDNGSGIRPRDLACIFEPGFSTKYSALTGDVQRGLGLTLVRDLVKEKYHGDLRVESKEGCGTVFTVLIPIENGDI